MASYTALEAVAMLDRSFSDVIDSDESDIEEDPSFPLPTLDSESNSENEDSSITANGKFDIAW